ncbi:MAG: glycosyltransferase [Hyphomicrobiales bacterium]|nr:glycosyltransferase [Hyphomicrobiales bacterium]
MSERASIGTRGRHALSGERADASASTPAALTPLSPLPPLIERETLQLSPLAGHRLLMTVSCGDAGLESRLAFDDCIETAATLFAHGLETVLVPVGCGPDEAQSLAARRIPGLSFSSEALPGLDALENLDAGALLSDMASAIGADLLLLHHPALAAGRRGRLPHVVACGSSALLRWKAAHGPSEAPQDDTQQAARERAGLLAADLVITPSLWFAETLKRDYGLPALPQVLHPATAPAAYACCDRGQYAFVLVADRPCEDGSDLAMLDRAAGRMCGAVLSLNPAQGAHGQPVCFENLHSLGPLSAMETQVLLARAPTFVSAARATACGRVVLQAAAQGCALVLSDIPAHREIWNGAACFVEPGNEEQFAAAMRRTLEDDTYRATLQDAALRRVNTLATERVGDRLHALLLPVFERSALTAAE